MIFRDGLDRASRGCAARASRVAAAAVAAAVTAAKQPPTRDRIRCGNLSRMRCHSHRFQRHQLPPVVCCSHCEQPVAFDAGDLC